MSQTPLQMIRDEIQYRLNNQQYATKSQILTALKSTCDRFGTPFVSEALRVSRVTVSRMINGHVWSVKVIEALGLDEAIVYKSKRGRPRKYIHHKDINAHDVKLAHIRDMQHQIRNQQQELNELREHIEHLQVFAGIPVGPV